MKFLIEALNDVLKMEQMQMNRTLNCEQATSEHLD